jgi:hypothetical protein
MVEPRELTEEEKKAGYKQIVYVRPADPSLGKGVIEQVSIETGEPTGKTFAPWETSQYAPGGRRGTGYLFVSLPAEPEVAAVIEKREDIRSEKEMAEKRGEAPPKSPSETWEAYIAKYGTQAKIPSKHILRKYRPQLEAAARKEAEARPPTREERIAETLARQRELERQKRIATTLARQRELEIRKEIPIKKEPTLPLPPAAVLAIRKAELERKKPVPIGEIRAAPKIKWHEKPKELARRFAFKAEKEVGLERAKYVVGAYAFGVVKYPIELGKMVVHPIRTIKGIKYTVTHPFETGYEFRRRLKYEAPIVAGEVTAMVGVGYVAPKVIKGISKKVVAKRAKVTIAEPAETIWLRKLPKGKELVLTKGGVAVKVGKRIYKIRAKGAIAGEPRIKGLQKITGKYQFQIVKPKVKKVIKAEAVVKGYTKEAKALYRAEIKVGKGKPIKLVTGVKGREILRVKGLREYAFYKQVWYPKRLERVGAGVFKEKMIAPRPFGLRGERVYGLYYAEEVGGKVVRAFETPSVLKKMVISKKAELIVEPLLKPKPRIETRFPPIPPLKEMVVKTVAGLYVKEMKIPSRFVFPTIKEAREEKRVAPIREFEPIVKPEVKPEVKLLPRLEVKPTRELAPVTKITPIIKTEVIPALKIIPITKVTPIQKVTPITKVSPILKITPIAKVTPIVSPVPMAKFVMPPPLPLIKKRRELKPTPAFRVELKRFGEFIPISKRPLPRGRALMLGAREARRTLGATFRLIPTERVTKLRDIPFRPSPLIFRGYKIKEGKKVPLKDVYIQFAHKRLSKATEVREIMEAKKKAPKKKKWRF